MALVWSTAGMPSLQERREYFLRVAVEDVVDVVIGDVLVAERNVVVYHLISQ